jgi:hypothetical protein
MQGSDQPRQLGIGHLADMGGNQGFDVMLWPG